MGTDAEVLWLLDSEHFALISAAIRGKFGYYNGEDP